MDLSYPITFTEGPANVHRRYQVHQPSIWNSKPRHFTYPPGGSLLESIFPHNPILSTLINLFTTPTLLCLYCTSRTLRYYLFGQRRCFRNLLLVPDSEAELWIEQKGGEGFVRRSAIEDVGLGIMWNTIITKLNDERTVIDPRQLDLITNGYLRDFFKDDPLLSALLNLTELNPSMPKIMKPKVLEKFFSRLMSRNLYALLQSLPAGRRLTSLILDGTGVETEYMKFVLPQIEGTLRGLSVKHCPNLECYTWSEWLLEALEETRPIALQWLHIWGSGNTPTTDFDFTQQPIPIEPLEVNENDPPCWEFPKPEEWAYKPSPFANVLPINFHINNTLKLLPAMTLTNLERHTYLNNLRVAVTAQYRNYLRNRHLDPTASWDAPTFPLGEPHPLIALLAIAKYSSIKLDVAFCVSRRDCYSFIYGRPYWQHINGTTPQPSISATIVHNATGGTVPLLLNSLDDDDVELHTHCVAEVGARRAGGGTVCQNCGLWEDEMSPEKFRQEGIIKEYAGIKLGTAIGDGRIAIGNCCTDCVREMTCAGCNSFYCPSCLFRSPLTSVLPPNPLAAESPSLKFLEWACPQVRHGPYCQQCTESEEYYMTCIDCNSHICYGCHGPTGFTVSSSLYTNGEGWDTDQEDEHFGVVGSIDEWEQGAYIGWGGTISEQGSDKGDDSDLPEGSKTPTQYNWKEPTTNYQPTDGEEMWDHEAWLRNLEQLSSNNNMTPNNYSSFLLPPNMGFPTPDVDEAMLLDTTPLRHQSLHSQYNSNREDYGEDIEIDSDAKSSTSPSWKASMMRMSETRIWETCAQCGIKTCAGCLGYEEVSLQLERGCEPEYRSCSGGCGRRFCESCLGTRGEMTGALVCGAVWNGEDIENDQQDIEESSIPKMAEMRGHVVSSEKDRKGVRCGAVLCIWCQWDQLVLAPSFCQGFDDIEVSNPKMRKGKETDGRLNDRRGLWRCERCVLGMEPEPL